MSAHTTVRRALLAVPLLLVPAALAAQNVTLAGDAAIYDLVGQVRLRPGGGGAVTVHVQALGEDAGKLRTATGRVGSWQTLRVIFPGDEIVYPALGRHNNTSLDVRDDGTFNDSDLLREAGAADPGRGHRVHVSGSGSGLRAHADLVVDVPTGKRVAVYLGVGRVDAENVDGQLRISSSSGDVGLSGVRGTTRVGTGSGDVQITNQSGELNAATGSGDVRINGARGGNLALHTGSGDVTGSAVAASVLDIGTGSGDVKLSGVTAPRATVGTGSGDVQLGLSGAVQAVKLTTGSGDATLALPGSVGATLRASTGSGDIESALPITVTRKREGVLEGTLGNGGGSIEVSTGSGDIHLTRG